MARRAEGIEVRHRVGCPAQNGAGCKCKPAYRAYLWSAAEGRKIKRTFPTLAAARSWRDDARGEVRRGRLTADAGPTLREAAEAWLASAKAGTVYTRSRDPFKPKTLREYEAALRHYVLPTLGARRLREIARPELQRFVGTLDGSPSHVRNAMLPLRAVFRHALAHGDVARTPPPGSSCPR